MTIKEQLEKRAEEQRQLDDEEAQKERNRRIQEDIGAAQAEATTIKLLEGFTYSVARQREATIIRVHVPYKARQPGRRQTFVIVLQWRNRPTTTNEHRRVLEVGLGFSRGGLASAGRMAGIEEAIISFIQQHYTVE